MKIRNGFVSNSSTSSFLILSPKDKFEQIMAQLTEYQRAVVNLITMPKRVFGQDMTVTEWSRGNEDTFEYIDKETITVFEEDDYDSRSQACDDFKYMAQEADCFVHSSNH